MEILQLVCSNGELTREIEIWKFSFMKAWVNFRKAWNNLGKSSG